MTATCKPLQSANRSWLGSARAPRAVFRALAENERIRLAVGVRQERKWDQELDARRVQTHPKVGVLPSLGVRVRPSYAPSFCPHYHRFLRP